jgi:hypothetical protein
MLIYYVYGGINDACDVYGETWGNSTLENSTRTHPAEQRTTRKGKLEKMFLHLHVPMCLFPRGYTRK